MAISLGVDPYWAAAVAFLLFGLLRPRSAWATARWAGRIVTGIVLLFMAAWPRR